MHNSKTQVASWTSRGRKDRGASQPHGGESWPPGRWRTRLLPKESTVYEASMEARPGDAARLVPVVRMLLIQDWRMALIRLLVKPYDLCWFKMLSRQLYQPLGLK